MNTNQWKMTHFERVAGAFVLFAILGMASIFVFVGVKKGWFESKAYFFTEIEDGEGLRAGSSVELAGVTIGEVTSIEMNSTNLLRVKIAILRRYRDRIREGTQIQLVRPFVVGEKALYLFSPDPSAKLLPELSKIPSEDVIGLTELLNGRKFLPYVQTLSAVFKEMKAIADLILKNKDSKKVAGIMDGLPVFLNQVGKLTNELSTLTRQMNDGENLRKVLRGLASASDALNKNLPEMADRAPQLAKDLSTVVGNLALLTEEFKKVLPALAEVAPELPRSSHRMVEALDEAVVVLKAMQKSFLLRGSAREVREEEALHAQEKQKGVEKPQEGSSDGERVPASNK